MSARASLMALALAATAFLFPSAAAAGTNAEIVTDSPDILIEIGWVFHPTYTLHAGTAADGSPVCAASPSNPVRVSFSPPTSVQVFPAPIFFTACETTQAIDLRVSAVLDGTMTITASDGVGTQYTTARGVTHIRSGIAGQFTPPVIDAPPSITKEAVSPLGAPVTTSFSATDPNNVASFDCTPTLTVFPLGTTPVTCVAYDSFGNRAQATTNITIVDTTPPRVQVPPNMSVTTPFVAYPTSTKFVTGGGLFARDLVSLNVPVVCDPPTGSRFPVGTTIVHCTATDARGNVGYGNLTVIVTDITSPTIRIVPSTVTYEATGPAGAIATFAPVVAYDIDLAPTYACAPPSGGTFPLGTTSVPCTARDASGNTASASVTVIVQDTTPPAITVPPTLRAEAWTSVGAPVTYEASAFDIVDLAVAPTCAPPSDSVFPMGSTTVTCTATDAHGNSASRSFIIRIVDSQPPSLGPLADITVEATGPAGASVAWPAVIGNDAIGGAIPATCTSAPGTFAIGATLVTCTATDPSGNWATATFTVTVRDTTPPAITVPAVVDARPWGPTAIATWPASATDLVDGTDAVVCVPTSGSTFPAGDTTVSCTSTDAHGNPASTTLIVRVAPIAPPTLAPLSDITLEATGPDGAAASWSPVSGLDGLGQLLPATCTSAPGTFALGSTVVSCSVRDPGGRTATATFRVTVRDTTPPTISLPASASATTYGATATVTFAASAVDLVDGTDAVTCAPASGSAFPVGDTLVTCTSTDAHGNSAARALTAHVTQAHAPTLGALPDPTLEATSPAGASASWTAPTATDWQGHPLVVTCAPAPGTFALGATTIACTATDAAGVSSTTTFTITVRDTTPPTIATPATTPTAITYGPTAIVTFATSATDIVDVTDAVACSPTSGSSFAPGDTIVACTSTDAHGNSASRTFTVHVTQASPPTVGPLSDITLEATGPSGAPTTWAPVVGRDWQGNAVPATCTSAPGTFALGSTLVTCTVTDGAGHSTGATFRVNVRDTTPPMITAPAAANAIAYGASAPVTFATSASDLVDGSDAVTCTPASGSSFAVGDTLVTCTSTDRAGNSATRSFTVHVTKASPPTVGARPDQTLEATGQNGASATWTPPTASDWRGNALLVACSPAPGTFALGTTIVMCTATDSAGVSSTSTFKIVVRDTTPPTIAVPTSSPSAVTYGASAIVTFAATASDIVDGSDAVTCSPASGSAFAPGDTIVTCASTDRAGNAATRTFTVHVTQAAPPTVGPLPDITLEATGPAGAAASWPTVTGKDWQGATLSATCGPAPGTFALGTTTVTCAVTDAAGVRSTTSFKVVVKDTTPPKITAPASFSAVGTNATGGGVSWNASATDAVDLSDPVTCAPASGSFFPVGATTVKCTSTDKAGNVATVAFTVTVSANAPPPSCNGSGTGSGSGWGSGSGSDGRERESDGSSSRTYSTYGSDAWRSSSESHHENDDENGGDHHATGGSTCPALAIASVPAQTIGAMSAAGANATWATPKTTGGSGAVTVTCAPASGSLFAIGATSVTCTARDALGATARTSFTITVAPACGAERSDDDRFSAGHENDAFRYSAGTGFSGQFSYECYGKDAKAPKLYYSNWTGGSEKALPERSGSSDCSKSGAKWKYDIDGKTLPKGDYKIRIDADGQTLGYAHVVVQ